MSSVQPMETDDLPESHLRVLDCAWELIARRGAANVTLAEIAKKAGVSRQAIYLFFGGRGRLLQAMTRRQDSTSGIRQRFSRAALDTPLPDALGTCIRTWFDYLPEISPVATALMGTAAVDKEAEDAWAERMASLRQVFAAVCRRLWAEGYLADGWTVEKATDFIYAQAHFSTWQHLVIERNWNQADATDVVVQAIERVLLAPIAPDRLSKNRHSSGARFRP